MIDVRYVDGILFEYVIFSVLTGLERNEQVVCVAVMFVIELILVSQEFLRGSVF